MDELKSVIDTYVKPEYFKADNVFKGTEAWEHMYVDSSATYPWDKNNLYIQHPPYFENIGSDNKVQGIKNANILALLGDSITTDHISPAGDIAAHESRR